jgi:arylsulfatase A-like enzyme
MGRAHAEERKLFLRQVEIFAAFAAYTGRVIKGFGDLGRLDNALVIYINGDTGTSAEGGRSAHGMKWRSSTASACPSTCR